MKKLLLLLQFVFFATVVYGQFPPTVNKFILNFQTSSKGVNNYGSGAPDYTPSSLYDTYEYEDTLTGNRYVWDHSEFIWKTHYYISNSPPVEIAGPPPVTYQDGLWYNPSSNSLLAWDGSGWVSSIGNIVRDTVFQIAVPGDTTTLSPIQGDIFVSTIPPVLGIYSGSFWVLFEGGSGGGPATTDDLPEGIINLYFNGKTTDQLPEGSTNFYYSESRFNSSFGTKSTTDLSEGANLYYTETRFNTSFGGKSTTDLPEGTNLYYTSARFDSDFSGKDTDDLPEGTTNLYFDGVGILDGGTLAGTRPTINFIEGTNITLTIADNGGSDRVDVTIDAAGGGGDPDQALSFTTPNLTISGTGGNSVDMSTLVLTESNISDLTHTGGTNLGIGAEVLKGVNGSNLEFRSIVSSTYVSALQTADEITISLNPHAVIHILGGPDEIDGDNLGIDYTPTNYTPTTSPPEASDLDHLTAHLSGIDAALTGGGDPDQTLSFTTPNLTISGTGGNSVDMSTLVLTESNISDLNHYTTSDFTTDFAAESTTNLSEGTNLYYTSARFDSDFSGKDTDDLGEGSTNLYFTDERVDDRVSSLIQTTSTIIWTYNDGGGTLSGSVIDDSSIQKTDISLSGSIIGSRRRLNLIQGSGATLSVIDNPGQNRIDITIGATGTGGGETNDGSNINISGVGVYDGKSGSTLQFRGVNNGDNTIGVSLDGLNNEIDLVVNEGNLSITESQISDLNHYTTSDFTTDFAAESTTNLSEGTNLYYTSARFDSDFSGKDTDDLGEGSTNLYFTDERVDDRVSSLIQDGTGISWTYNDGGGTLTANVVPGQIDHNLLSNYIADEHIPHSGVILTAGTGLDGGGSIELSRSLFVDFQELTLVSQFKTDTSQVILYNEITGDEERIKKTDFQSDLSITESQISDLDHYTTSDFTTDFAAESTTNLSEGTNLYYTSARFDSDFSGKDTDDLPEGTTNLYFDGVGILDGGSLVGTRPTINFIEGTNITLTIADNGGSDRVDVTIDAAGGGGDPDQTLSFTTPNLTISGTGGNSVDMSTLVLTESNISDLTHTGGTNLGIGAEVLKGVNGSNLEFRSIVSSTYVSALQTADEITISLNPHAVIHILGGPDEIDGDNLGIDYTPTNYTPTTSPPEASDLDHLTAHLSGIDAALTGGGDPDQTLSFTTPNLTISGTGGNSVDMSTLVLTESNISDLNHYTTSDFTTDFAAESTTNLSEGTNLYYTSARFDSDFSGKDTDDLGEGSTNLYFTDERVDDRVSSLIIDGSNISWTYTDGSNTLQGDLDYPSLDSQTSGTVNLLSASVYHRIIDMASAGGSITMTLNNPKDGGYYTIVFVNAANTDIVTWPSNVKLEDGSVIGTDVLDHNNGKRRIVSMIYDGTDFWTYYSE